MRKDVRLGLAVGGILFGAVMVYVVFFTSSHKGPGHQGGQANHDTAAAPAAAPTGNIAAAPANTTTQFPPLPVAPADAAPTPSTAAGSGSLTASSNNTGTAVTISGPDATTTTPATPPAAVTPPPAAAASTDVAAPAAADTTPSLAGIPWDKLCKDGPLASKTPTPGAPVATAPVDPLAVPGGSVGTSTPGVAINTPASPPPSGSARTYIVKPKETYWSIAQAEYGNGIYANALMKANPTIKPGALKAGARLTLPDKNDVVPTHLTKADMAGPTTRPIDPNLQYRVQSGDNLYTICKRVYGNTEKVDLLYKLNKDLIGPNPAALKPKMVLQLPEPPASAAAPATTASAPAELMGGR